MTAPKVRAQQAAAHDAWFRKQVQASIDDPRPSVDDELVLQQFAAKRRARSPRSLASKKVAAD